MTYLGTRTVGAAPGFSVAHQEKSACKFTTGLTGFTPTMAFACLRLTAVATPTITFAIYTDNAGAPNALVANSTLTLGVYPAGITDGSWCGARYTTSPTLAASTSYWLCLQVEGAPGDSVAFANAVGSANQLANVITDALPLADPYGAVGGYTASNLSVFVEDDAGATVTGRVVIPPENVVRHGG